MRKLKMGAKIGAHHVNEEVESWLVPLLRF